MICGDGRASEAKKIGQARINCIACGVKVNAKAKAKRDAKTEVQTKEK